jgi:hypothetical protein
MSTIVSHVILTVDWPLETPVRIGDKWADNLKGNALTLYQNLLASIPDSFKFQEKIAGPASQGFAEFVNPAFVSRSGDKMSNIVDSHGTNLREAYEKFVRNLTHAFETVDGVEAKRFKDKVEKAKENFLNGFARRTLLFGGTKRDGRGPATLASYWLTKDRRVSGWLREGDRVMEGGPYQVTQTMDRSAFKAALTERLIQAGIRIIKSNFSAAVIAEENGQNNQLVQKFVDPGLGLHPFATGGDSRVDFTLEHHQLFLELKASQI